MDESFSAIAAIKTAEHGLPLLDSGVIYGRAFTHTYLLASLIKLFGVSEFILRLPSAIFSILSIALVYLFAIRIFKSRIIGLISAAFMAFGYFDIAWARQIRMYSELQFFYLFSLYFFYQYLASKKSSWALLAGSVLSGLLAVATHNLGLFVIPSFLILWAFFKGNRKKNKVILIAGLAFLILSFFALKGWHLFDSFIRNFEHVRFYFLDYLVFLGFSHFFVLALAIAGFVFAFEKRNKPILAFNVIFAASILLISINHKVGMRYLFIVIPILYMLAGYGASQLWKYRCPIIKVAIGILLALAVLRMNFILLPQANYFLEFDPFSKNPKLDYTPQPDLKRAYAFLEEQKKEDDLFIVAHTAIHQWYMPDKQFYWLGFNFRNDQRLPNHAIVEHEGYFVDYYTGVGIVDDLEILEDLMAKKHGYIIWDFFAVDDRINQNSKQFVEKKAELIYHHQANKNLPWTQVWIYKF